MPLPRFFSFVRYEAFYPQHGLDDVADSSSGESV